MIPMRNISDEMQTALDSGDTALVLCVEATRKDGITYRYTAAAKNLEIGGETYFSSAGGFLASNFQADAALNVDGMEVEGSNDALLDHPSITEDDLRAGLWDRCAIAFFMADEEHLDRGIIGPIVSGNLGEVEMKRHKFRAEFRGIMQRYQRSTGRVYAPACSWTLGDEHCQKDLGGSASAFTFTAQAIDSVSDDGMVIYILGRTEPGPGEGVGVTGITKDEQAVVTTAAPHGFAVGITIILSGVTGMTALNTPQVVMEVPSATTFAIATDTTEFPDYTGGGTATAMGAQSGWFDFGTMTFEAGSSGGLNAGFTRDIRAYLPASDSTGAAQFMLAEPFPYQVMAGDLVTLVAGCDKLPETCKSKFDNYLRFGGFNHLRGNDLLAQIGRQ